MKIGDVVNLALVDLHELFDVRESLNHDHVRVLIEARNGGAKLTPLQVWKRWDGKLILIDGRHRLQAARDLGDTLIECLIVTFKSSQEALIAAASANCGGSLPPTRRDCIKLAVTFLKDKIDKKKFPYTVGKQIWQEASSRILHEKIHAASRLVLDGGMTAKKAAEAQGVEEKALKNYIDPEAHRKGVTVAQVKTKITVYFNKLIGSVKLQQEEYIRDFPYVDQLELGKHEQSQVRRLADIVRHKLDRINDHLD